MSERESDIEFDFFEEPETREAARPERPPQRGGPRPPVRTPQGLTPLLRLVGLIAFAIVIVVLLVYAIEGCQSSSKHAKYDHYITKVRDIASHSQSTGNRLTALLTQAGIKTADLQNRLAGLARDAQQTADTARALDPPGRLRGQDMAMIQALDYRYSGLVGIADALRQTLAKKGTSGAGALVEGPALRLIASDVIWSDSFKTPTGQVLQNQGVGDIRVPGSTFVQNPDFFTATSLNSIIGRLKGGSVTPTQGGLHGTNIVKTVALPRGTELSTTTQLPVIATTDLAFAVTIKDSGNSAEVNIPVTLSVEQSPPLQKKQIVRFINPGEEKTVVFRNIGAPQFTTPVKIKVVVSPVPGEHNTTNNTSEYPVIFSLPQ